MPGERRLTAVAADDDAMARLDDDIDMMPRDVNRANTPLPKTRMDLTPEQLTAKKKKARLFANIFPVIAAFGKALKDGFGAMTLYSLIFFGELKLTAALLNPWIGAVIGFLAVALFVISLGMEGKSLRQRILGALSRWQKVDLAHDDAAPTPVNGWFNRASIYFAIGVAKLLRWFAPWTAAVCKGISGMGSTAGCLLLVLAGAGAIASTALVGPIAWTVIAVSAIVGITLGLVSRYKEGDDCIQEFDKFQARCFARLALPQDAKKGVALAPNVDVPVQLAEDTPPGSVPYPAPVARAGALETPSRWPLDTGTRTPMPVGELWGGLFSSPMQSAPCTPRPRPAAVYPPSAYGDGDARLAVAASSAA